MQQLPLAQEEGARPTFEILEPRLLLSSGPIISEFMALNDSVLQDEDSEYSDWIEVHNPTASTISLNGWHLTDDAAFDPGDVWTFPDITLGPGEYRIIFASGKDRRDPGGNLHTDFKLAGDGEYLALLDPAFAIVHEYDPFPQQLDDISYGVLYDYQGRTDFVSRGDVAGYLIPSNASLGLSWVDEAFNDSGWQTGATGLGFGLGVPGGSTTLVSVGSVWKYLDNGSNQSTAWRASSFDDGAWAAGPAELGYGDGGEATVVSFGPDSGHKYPTTYFRHSFNVSQAWQVSELTVRLRRDDGAVVYLNGQEIVRTNMPTGDISYTTYASGTVGGSDETTYFEFLVDPSGILVDGPNVLAVEIHQGNASSSDISFDLALEAELSTSELLATDIEGQMLDVNATCYLRLPFDVVDPAEYTELYLQVAYEDGYVAYLNGTEVARRNAPTTPAWNSAAASDRPIEQAVQYELVDLTSCLALLEAGGNVLAIHAMNDGASNESFLICPELYGLASVDIQENYFTTPTPGAANIPGVLGKVADTGFTVDRGFYDEPFEVEITSATPGAQIRYTLDGEEPTATTGTIYTGPITISTTTCLRAAAYKPGYMPTNVDTQTYIFLDDVIQQPADPAGFPAMWNTTVANYQVDPDVVNNPLYSGTIKNDLRSIPTVSLVADVGDLFGSNGIYANPGSQGIAWERSASIEWINPDGTTAFQANAGLRIQGGASRGAGNKKHSFRVLFKGIYGATKLNYPVFGDEAVDEFDTFILRAGYNDTWPNNGSATYLQDRWAAETELAMGGAASHGTYVHLYVNGLYWGLYNPVERPDDAFAASYLGGEKEDYDVYSIEGLKEGNSTAWNQLLSLVASPVANYSAIEQMLDIPAFVDYMILNQYGANWDWPQNNWWATYDRVSPGQWHWHSWDAEGCLSNVNGNRVEMFGSNLGYIYQQLRLVEEFRVVYGDHVHRHLFNGGQLTPAVNIAWLNSVASAIDRAVVGESARWGDGYDDTRTPLTRDNNWLPRINWLRNTFFPQRTAIVLQQFKDAELYPNINAPSFRINGSYQHGGAIDVGDSLSMTASAGTIYYTLDGTDPRQTGGGISPAAQVYNAAVQLNESTRVMARLYAGSQWSALNEAVYLADTDVPLRVTEIMYNPAAPTPAEQLAGYVDNDDFEYIELQNAGFQALNLKGFQFAQGIDYTFGDITLAAGQYVVVAKNPAAFLTRYDAFAGTVVGPFAGGTSLANDGEPIGLYDAFGVIVQTFTYDDGWYGVTDGGGYSLTVRDAGQDLSLWSEAAGWKASEFLDGTPGVDDSGYNPGSIVISEVLAHSNFAPNDWIELYNATDQEIEIGGWYLSDTSDGLEGGLTKYQIALGTTIGPHEYLVLTQDAHFGSAFALSELGDEVFLSSQNTEGGLGGYREHVDFGASPAEMTFGRYIRSTGEVDFTLLSAATPGTSNTTADPFVGPLVINELMYHPTDPPEGGEYGDEDFEYIELLNWSDSPVDLRHVYVSGGVGFTFGWMDTDVSGTSAWTRQAGATATWTATLPVAGDYYVYVRYNGLDLEGNDRNLDGQASYRVDYSGGSETVELDQDNHSGVWVLLGVYPFQAGAASVTLSRQTDDPDEWTIADEVKFIRGGTEVVVDNQSGGFSTTGSEVTTLGAGEYVVLVKNLTAFGERHDIVGENINVAGEYTGSLSNDGDIVKLFQATTPEAGGYIPYVRIDQVEYNDVAPWPTDADGGGMSLNRTVPGMYGNDVLNWAPSAAGGTPGRLNVINDISAPTAPSGVEATAVTSRRIDLTWEAATDLQSGVDHYVIYRNGQVAGTSEDLFFSDENLTETQVYEYRVSAVNPSGHEGVRSEAIYATPRPSLQSVKVEDPTHVTVRFGKPVELTTAQTAGNYTVEDSEGQPIAVIGAVRQTDASRVTLSLSGIITEEETYSLSVTGVEDLYGNEVESGSEVEFFYRDVDDTLVAWWTFDESSGTMEVDATGNGRNLELVGATRTAGRVGSALQFDGVDDYAEDALGGEYVNGLSSLTVAMWIKPDQTGTDQGFFTTHEPGTTRSVNLRYDTMGWGGKASETIKAYVQTEGGRGWLEAGEGVQTTDWQHVALTWSESSGMCLYVDGALQSVTFSGGSPSGVVNQATKVVLGMGEINGLPFAGLMDDVRIYNRVLSEEDVAKLANLDPEAADDGGYEATTGVALHVGAAQGVLANDHDPDGAPAALAASYVSGPSHGLLTLHEDGAFDYTATGGYTGPDAFVYQAYDGLEYSNTAEVTINVTSPPSPPEAPSSLPEAMETPEPLPAAARLSEPATSTAASPTAVTPPAPSLLSLSGEASPLDLLAGITEETVQPETASPSPASLDLDLLDVLAAPDLRALAT